MRRVLQECDDTYAEWFGEQRMNEAQIRIIRRMNGVTRYYLRNKFRYIRCIGIDMTLIAEKIENRPKWFRRVVRSEESEAKNVLFPIRNSSRNLLYDVFDRRKTLIQKESSENPQ
ncbi:Hypothetical protein CINCED_3A023766 [Cinara cedri]|uniref:Uncharacterized protein n=1 Tax=Cinara cedri TaxID=506608 RepID=A0A5E4N4U3_9HEMI|nr:Hypothetical protein CINCED_3A023766 [Cinara cedri]